MLAVAAAPDYGRGLQPETAVFFVLSLVKSKFPSGSDSKESACNAGDPGSIPGSGRFPGEGHDNPLQYSHPENSMNRGAWQATYSPWGHKEATTERLTLSKVGT